MSAITPCPWHDDQGEEAARYYVSLFPGSAIRTISYEGAENPARQGRHSSSSSCSTVGRSRR